MLAMLVAAAPTLAAAQDAAARSDVVTALGTRAEVRSHARVCEEQAGAEGWQFRWAEYFWEGGNFAALREAELFVASLSAEERRSLESSVDAFASRKGAARKATSAISLGGADAPACRTLAEQISYEHRHDLLGEAVVQRLEAAYAARRGGAEVVRREVQREDMVIGCTKSQLRQGRHDFEPVRAVCRCIIEAMVSSATPAEIDTYIQSLSLRAQDQAAAREQLMKQRWMQTAIPKIQTCNSVAR